MLSTHTASLVGWWLGGLAGTSTRGVRGAALSPFSLSTHLVKESAVMESDAAAVNLIPDLSEFTQL